MTVKEMIARLELVARTAPDMIVMLSKGDDKNWFDEVQDVGICRINKDHDNLHCGPHDIDDEGEEDVLVIH